MERVKLPPDAHLREITYFKSTVCLVFIPAPFSADIPKLVLQDLQNHLNSIRDLLAPYERKTMLRMADKLVAFVQKTTEYATLRGFVPIFVSLEELKQNVASMVGLTPLQQLTLYLDSTVMSAGSEAHSHSLTIYNNSKFLAQNKQPGAQATYEDLEAALHQPEPHQSRTTQEYTSLATPAPVGRHVGRKGRKKNQ